MFTRLIRTKTFWAAITAIIGAAEQVAIGAIPLAQGVQIAVPALLALLLRDGIARQSPLASNSKKIQVP